MTSQPDALLAIEPAHLPHYTHGAVIVGSVIILAIITLVAGVALAIAHHLVSPGLMTHRDQGLQHSLDEIRFGAPLPVTEAARDAYAQVAQDGWEKQDVTALVEYGRRSP